VKRCVLQVNSWVRAGGALWPLRPGLACPSSCPRRCAARPEASGRLFRQLNLEYLLRFRYQATCESSGDRLSDLLRGADPVRAGHNVICELVNAFNPLVYPWGNAPVEAPGLDLTGGIRPVLYYMLRREYLHAGGIGICRNTECRDLFEIERSGSEFCGDVCSRLQRQREYWRNRGKKMRKRRLKTGDRRATIVSGNPTEPHEKRKERKP
jgi:hypothetical protein